MTTIFADAKAGVMVADSKCTSGEQWFPMTKVHRVDGELIGIVGTVSEAMTWLDWYKAGKRGAKPKLASFGALVLRSTGIYEVSCDGAEQLVERGFHGAGSGGGYAVAAFKGGADAERAVQIACEIDSNSGGDVVVHTLAT